MRQYAGLTPSFPDCVGSLRYDLKDAILKGLLWKKTTVSQAWRAENLGMKNVANASRAFHIMGLSLSEKKVSQK